MHGLPGQAVDDALSDLERALSLSPTHLSWYQLTIEQNTEFYRYPPKLPEDDLLWEIQQAGAGILQASGFSQYEVSAYSKTGQQAQHNLNYWRFGDYIGIGAGAHSKLSYLNAEGSVIQQRRYRKTRMPSDYLKTIATSTLAVSGGMGLRLGETAIPQEDLSVEFLMNVLRLKQGVEENLFTTRTGLSIDVLEPALTELRALGLMKDKGLCTTDKGLLFLNTVLEKFAEN